MPDREKVIKALSICFPETQDDSKLECSDCPYGDVCNPNDIVGITLPLIWDIRALLKEQEEIVHCKDCHYRCLEERPILCQVMADDWFCADGVKQND